MRLPMSFVAVLLFASITSSQIVDPKDHPKKASSIVPAALKASGGQLVVIDAKSAKGDVSFRWDKVVFENRATVDGKKLFLSVPESDDERTYSVEMISWDDRLTETTNIVVQGKKIPVPVPPDLTPSDLSKRLDKIDAAIAAIETRLLYLEKIKPNPPPEPKPAVAPIAIDGLSVLIMEETAKRTPEIAMIIFSDRVRSYLNSHCAPVQGKLTKEWWMIDQDTDVSGLPKAWQDAKKRAVASVASWKPTIDAIGQLQGPASPLPWIIISNTKGTSYEGPLPATIDETVALLKKHGGE